MMNKHVRWFGAVMSTVLLASTLAACAGKESPGDASNGDKNKATVTLKVEVFDRGNAPAGAGPVDNNYWTQWIQTEFGDPNHIKLEFVPVPRNQETEKLNVLMATGDAPDIVFAYDMNTVNNYVKSGGLAEVGELIEEHAPNLKAFLGEEVLSYGVFNGKQMTIPAKRTLQYTQSSYIRKDWLDELGLPVPTTTEQFYDTMKAFKEKDPGNTGGKVIPYGFSALGGSGINTPVVLASSFVEDMSEEDFYAYSTTRPVLEIVKPGFKEGVQFLNKMKNEGLIDSEFALDKDGKVFDRNVANGLVGAFTAVAAHPTLIGPGNLFDTLKNNVPGAEYVAMDPFTNEEGKHPKNIYGPAGMHIMIPKSSNRAVEAIKYLDWMAQQDVLFTLSNGHEGEHYTLENGYPKTITNDEAKKTFYNNVDIAIIVNGKDYGTLEKNIEATALAYPDYVELAKQSIRNGLQDGYTEPRFDRPIDAENKYNKTLVDKSQEAVVKSILAKPEQFSSTFDSFVDEYLKLGGQAVIDERRAAYNEMKSK
jgi:putative aldouronate transport system substrate-binding protein